MDVRRGPYRDAAPSPLVRVVFWNDPKTTIGFVMAPVRAHALTLAVHQDGWTDIGTYPQPEAEALVAQSVGLANMRGFPFRASVASLDGEPRATALVRWRNRWRAWLVPTSHLRDRKPSPGLIAPMACSRYGTSSTEHRLLADALVCTACHRSFGSIRS